MKKVIRGSEDTFPTKVFRYDIEVRLVSEIAEAIDPILREYGTVDQLALNEYEEFLINVMAVLDAHEFEIIDDHGSSKSETSYYISAFKKSESTADDIKCIFFFRVSGYPLPEGLEKSEIEKLEKGSCKKQIWWVKNVVINGDVFNSYDEALDGLEEKMMQVSKCE